MDSNYFICNKKKKGRKEERKEGRGEGNKERRRQEGTSNLNKAIEIGARIENKTQEDCFVFVCLLFVFLLVISAGGSVVDSIKNCC